MRATSILQAMLFGAAAFAPLSSARALTPGEVYKQAGPAVVLLLGSDDGKSGSAGTGSIITGEGKVITNAHVVINESGQPFKTLYVFLKPPKITGDNKVDLSSRFKATVLKWSPAEELDLALVQIEAAPQNLPTIQFGNPERMEIGDQAVAIGHPEQGGLWTLTTGAISTVIANFGGIEGKHVVQTECSVNRGNSGGPLLNNEGHMVGINTAIARRGAGGVAITAVNFAIKSSVAVSWLSGQGMGLAYASPAKKEVVVAIAPEPIAPSAPSAAAPPPAATASAAPPPAAAKPVTVAQPPPATIVVAEAPAATKPEALVVQAKKTREEGKTLGTEKEAEKLTAGKAVDPKTQKEPTYHTPKKPVNLDDIRAMQMREMEDMMDEMRGKVGNKKSGW